MKIHHIGYLVENINLSINEFIKFGYKKTDDIIKDETRDIHIIFMYNGELFIELIQPASVSSPIFGLLKKYKNSPYHICYETENLQKEIEKQIGGGGVLIQSPSPAPAILGCPNVAFLMLPHIGIVELVEKII